MFNILIVDDQISVLNGILNGIDFQALHIDTVYTAVDASRAKEIIQTKDVHILLSDIEMPGENGLELNKWVSERYPSIVRVLLTSHASFDYVKESIKIGCFDYIVQPAPYHEIEDVIRRAVAKICTDRRNAGYYNLEGLSNIVLNLFSSNPSNKQQSIASLRQLGYVITDESHIQSVLIDIYPYSDSVAPSFSDLSIFAAITETAREAFLDPDIHNLVCLNRYKQFVLLLFCGGDSINNLSADSYKAFYQGICKRISSECACYVSPTSRVAQIRKMIYTAHRNMLDNVAKRPGLYFADGKEPVSETTSLSENVARWMRLVENNQFDTLEESIFSFLDYNASLNRLNLETLSEFHQELAKIFFVYSHNHKIDIMGLFSAEYTYNDYMGSFKNIESLKKGVSYLKNAIAAAPREDAAKDTVPRAIDFILSNLSRDISVKDVADYVSFSPEYFSKLFKKETGENVKNYILRVKVEAAKDLLKNPNIPISMIALELGYGNFSHFTQMFRKHESITPSEYRKQFLNQN